MAKRGGFPGGMPGNMNNRIFWTLSIMTET